MSSTNNNIKEAQRWLNQARYDLQSAYHSSGGEFYSTACFQAQQAAEKALKALLIRRGRRGLLSHSTLQLIKELASENEDILAYTKHARILDRFYIPTRYPDALPDGSPYEAFDREDAVQALHLAQEIFDFVESHM